jgi:hypothetical protein
MDVNTGIESMTPHAKINFVNNATTTTLTTQNTWYKIGGTNTNSYTKKIGIGNNKMTFLSSHPRDGVMFISASIKTSATPRDIQIAVVKNGTSPSATPTKFGDMGGTTESNNRPISISTNVYLQAVNKNDYFEVWARCTSNNTVTLTVSNLAWTADFR